MRSKKQSLSNRSKLYSPSITELLTQWHLLKARKSILSHSDTSDRRSSGNLITISTLPLQDPRLRGDDGPNLAPFQTVTKIALSKAIVQISEIEQFPVNTGEIQEAGKREYIPLLW